MQKKIIFLIFGALLITTFGLLFKSKIGQSVSYICLTNETALTSMEKGGHRAETKDYSFGKMIVAIDKTPQGNGKYWLYTIDGRDATISADNYRCLGGENITWVLK